MSQLSIFAGKQQNTTQAYWTKKVTYGGILEYREDGNLETQIREKGQGLGQIQRQQGLLNHLT